MAEEWLILYPAWVEVELIIAMVVETRHVVKRDMSISYMMEDDTSRMRVKFRNTSLKIIRFLISGTIIVTVYRLLSNIQDEDMNSIAGAGGDHHRHAGNGQHLPQHGTGQASSHIAGSPTQPTKTAASAGLKVGISR